MSGSEDTEGMRQEWLNFCAKDSTVNINDKGDVVRSWEACRIIHDPYLINVVKKVRVDKYVEHASIVLAGWWSWSRESVERVD